MPNQKLVIRLEPRIEALPELLDKVEAYTKATNIASQAEYRIAVVCEELITNVAMHGSGGDDGATYIEITIDRDADNVRLSVEDNGRPFDPLAEPPPDTELELEDRDIGGLGIHFVRRLVKSIAYKRINKRNCLTAVFDATE